MEEVFPNIFLIQEKGKFGAIKPPENIYILAGPDGLIFDAGYGNKKTINYVVRKVKHLEQSYNEKGEKINLTRIIPSHWHPDHSSGLKSLREKLGVRILMTKKTSDILKSKKDFRTNFEPQDYQEEMLNVRSRTRRIISKISQFFVWRLYRRLYGLNFIDEPDQIIQQNSIISINGESWQIISSPGHASDHIYLYNEEKGVLFSGDNILRTITTWLGPPECNIGDYVNSVKQAERLPKLELILPAHGSPITNPSERISEIIKHRKVRKEQVLKLVKESAQNGISPSGIINKLYLNNTAVIQNVARGWICLTLRMLEEEGLIKRRIERNKIKFYPA